MPSDSTGLKEGGGQPVPSLDIPDQEHDFLYASVGDEIEISHIPVRDSLQNINNDALSPTVCNKTSEMVRNSPQMATKEKTSLKRKNNSPSKANKKRRKLSPEERQRRSDAMKAILARKAERKTQGVV